MEKGFRVEGSLDKVLASGMGLLGPSNFPFLSFFCFVTRSSSWLRCPSQSYGLLPFFLVLGDVRCACRYVTPGGPRPLECRVGA